MNGTTKAFAAVYGQFDEHVIGGSSNCPTPTSLPDVTKPIVYFKGDAAGQAYFSAPNAPPPCASFTHIILVFDIQNDTIVIRGKNGDIAHTIALSQATNITMQDVAHPELWCKTVSVPLAATARSTSSTVSSWVVGISIAVVVVIALLVLPVVLRSYNNRKISQRAAKI
jgi:hypothetical protein